MIGALARNSDLGLLAEAEAGTGPPTHPNLALTPTETTTLSRQLASLDPALLEVKHLLSSLSARLRRATTEEIQGTKACFMPVAPLLVGFFLLSAQLGAVELLI